MRYKIIYCDPPWSYNDKNPRGGAANHYDTMSFEDLLNLPVEKIAADNSVCFMWATFPLLQNALDLLRHWGFEYKNLGFLWVKGNKKFNPNQTAFFPYESLDDFMGLGHWTRGNSEPCILGVRGKPKRISNSVRQIVYSPIQAHSRKPPEVRDRIVKLMGDQSRIELFARERAKWWHAWGNEVESDIKMEAL